MFSGFFCAVTLTDRNVTVIFQGSQLLEKARPEKGFFIKSKKRYVSAKDGREHSRFSFSQYCTALLSGKHPRAAFTEEELDLLRNLKKSRADVLLQFNAMVAEFAHLPAEQRMRLVINGRSYDWWREHLITALEFFDKMREKVSDNAG